MFRLQMSSFQYFLIFCEQTVPIFYGITFSDSLALKPSNFMGIEGHRSDLIENEIIRPSCETFIFYQINLNQNIFLIIENFRSWGGFRADTVTKPRKWSFINSFHSWLSGQSLRKAVLLEYFPTFQRIWLLEAQKYFLVSDRLFVHMNYCAYVYVCVILYVFVPVCMISDNKDILLSNVLRFG